MPGDGVLPTMVSGCVMAILWLPITDTKRKFLVLSMAATVGSIQSHIVELIIDAGENMAIH
jgi:hypothetical protein